MDDCFVSTQSTLRLLTGWSQTRQGNLLLCQNVGEVLKKVSPLLIDGPASLTLHNTSPHEHQSGQFLKFKW